MKYVLRQFVVSAALIATITSPVTAIAEVDSKISEEFESSATYWNKINRQMDKFFNIPTYFNVPYTSFAPLKAELLESRTANSPTAPVLINYRETNRRTQNDFPESELGLRLIVVNASADRKTNARELGESGLFEAGDVVLSYRKEWFQTLRYSHIQLGVSHAGLLYFEKGSDGRTYLKNLDMPLDDKHVGEGYLNSEHYKGAPLLHVVRARNMTPAQKQNVNSWIQKLAKVGPKAYQDSKIRFNTDYADPKYEAGQPLTFVGDIGRVALSIPNKQTITVYCSEFAWAVLSMRDCNPDDEKTVADFKKGGAPACLNEVFAPMPLLGTITTDGYVNTSVGLIDGVPLIMANQGQRIADPKKRSATLDRMIRRTVFSEADGNATNISSGHRSVEEAVLKSNPKFYDFLANYYFKVNDEGAATHPEVLGTRAQMNPTQALNYSPTAFIVHGLLPHQATVKAFDYIGTIGYAGKVGKVDAYKAIRTLKVDGSK